MIINITVEKLCCILFPIEMTSLDDDVHFSEFCKINSENTQLMVLKHATFYTCLIFIERQCENIRSKRCIAHDNTAFANYRLFQYYAILS